MKAVVMAGGFGSRLYPLTAECPKPMIPFVNKPVLAHILNLLKYHHFTEVIITVQYLAHHIQNYFGDGSRLGLTLHYAVEETPLGTAGGVKNAQRYLDDESFLVISGDIITDINLTHLWQFHRNRQAVATLALKQIANPQEFGAVITDRTGRVLRYVEKTENVRVVSNIVNTGIYVLEPEVLDWLEPHQNYDFSYHVFPHLVKQNAHFFGCLVNGYWRDVGAIPSYLQAIVDTLMGKVGHINLGRRLEGNVWVDQNVAIAPDATLYGPIYLGRGVKIRPGATIYGPTVIGDHTVVDRGAWIERSIIGRDCWIDASAEIQEMIISQRCHFAVETVASNRIELNKRPVVFESV